MCRRLDTLRAVDGDADVAVALEQRLAAVQAHAHTHLHALGPLVAGKRPLRRNRRGNRIGGGAEDDEERVALRVDLDSAVLRECGAQQPVVLRQDLAVALPPERRQQARRALHVREQERDGAGRKLGHASILRCETVGDKAAPAAGV